ncbi:MAG: hypothetical protein ACOYOB_20035 [Myxococcota bacterium]
MILLADNDVLLKLAQYDLLDDALSALRVRYGRVCVLPTARFVFRRHQPAVARRRLGDDVVARLERAFQHLEVLDDAPGPALIERLVPHQDIDGGEAILLAWLVEHVQGQMITGDKRSLRAFAAAPDLGDLRDVCAGRLVCFEQFLIWMLSSTIGPVVLAKLRLKPDVDKAVRLAIGAAADPSPEETCVGLESYVGDLVHCGVPLAARFDLTPAQGSAT